MEHGVYIPTLQNLMLTMRARLKDLYRIDEIMENDLKLKLQCEEEDIPFQLGYIPTKMVVETLIYGPEIHMFDKSISEKLKLFYWNIYSASNLNRNKITKTAVPFSDSTRGKFWIELPVRLDKRLQNIKDEFFDEMIKKTPEFILKDMDKNALDVNLSRTDRAHYKEFVLEFFIGMSRKYEFQETMVVHSVVRALQLSKGDAIIYPRSEDAIEVEHEYNNLKKKKLLSFMKPEERDEIFSKMKREHVEIRTFVDFILNLDSQSSSFVLFNGLKEVVNTYEKNMEKIGTMTTKTKFMHPTMRTVRFFTNEVGVMVNSSEMINYLFDPSRDFSNTTIQTFSYMVSSSGMKWDTDQMHREPFRFIKEFMGNREFAFKSFKEYLDTFSKSLKFVKIIMMSDSPCTGNMKDNLLNFYRTRSSPNFIYEDPSLSRKTPEDIEFISSVSLNTMETKRGNIMDITNISLSDNKLSQFRKLWMVSKGSWTDSYFVQYNRIQYRVYNLGKSKVKVWSDLNILITAVEDLDYQQERKRTNILMYSTEDLDNLSTSENIMAVFRRYINERMSEDSEIIYTQEKLKTNMYSERYYTFYQVSDLEFKTSVNYGDVSWKGYLDVRATISNHENKFGTARFFLYEDPYTVSQEHINGLTYNSSYGDELTMEEIMAEPLPLEELEKMFTEMGWMSENFLPDFNAKSEETKMKESMDRLRELNKSFGLINMKETIASVMGSLTYRYPDEDDDDGNMEDSKGKSVELSSLRSFESSAKSYKSRSSKKSKSNLSEPELKRRLELLDSSSPARVIRAREKEMNVTSIFRDTADTKQDEKGKEKEKETVGNSTLSVGLLQSIAGALNDMEERDEMDDLDSFDQSKMSIVRLMDKMVSMSVNEFTKLKRDEIKSFLKIARMSHEKMNRFHSFLFFCVQKMLDFKASDSFCVMVYNVILKNLPMMTTMPPSYNLRRYSESDMDESMERRLLVVKVSEERDLDDILSKF